MAPTFSPSDAPHAREAAPSSPFTLGQRLALARSLALFGLAFALMAGLIHHHALKGLPRSALGVLGDKLALLERQKDRVDLIFLGSSRINQGVDPKVFDDALAKSGCPGARSFNFGVEHLNPVETRWLVERIAELRPARLRWIVAEMPVARYQIMWENRHALRYRALVGLDNLSDYVEDIRRQPILLRHRLADGAMFAGTLLHDATAIGLLSRLLFPLASEDREVNRPMPRRAGDGEPGQGFYYDYMAENLPPPGSTPQEAESWAARAIAQIDQWKADYAQRNGAGHFARLRPVLASIRDAGYAPILLSVPSIVSYAISQPVMDEARRALPDLPLLDFNDPRLHPEFFLGDHLYGASHLNAGGAALLSRKLAQALRPVLAPLCRQTSEGNGHALH